MPPRPRVRRLSLFLAVATLAFSLAAVAQPRLDFATDTRWFPIADAVPNQLLNGDFDEDGNLDFAVTTHTPSVVQIFLGDGGRFRVAGSHPYPAGIGTALADDVDRDGHWDVAFTSSVGPSTGAIAVLFGDGLGSFPRTKTVALPTSIAVGIVAADLDADADVDFITGRYHTDFVLVVENLGSGDLGEPRPVAAGPWPIPNLSADVDRDGNLDLVVINSDNTGGIGLSFLAGDGALSFSQPTPIPVQSGAFGAELADFDGDDRLDLAVSHYFLDRVTVLDGDGTGGFASERALLDDFFEPFGITAKDANGDGLADISLITNHSTLAIFDGDGAGGFSPATRVPSADRAGPPLIADVDNDGHFDVASMGLGSRDICVLLGPDFGTAPAYPIGAGSVRSLAVGDFDEDGVVDAVTAGTAAASGVLLSGNGTGGFTVSGAVSTGDENRGVATADFDGDGHVDLALTNVNRDTVSVFLGDGAGSFAPHAELPVGIAPASIVVSDFDGDLVDDLAVVNGGSGCPFPDCSFDADISILLGDGTGGFAPMPRVAGGASLIFAVIAGDFSGDGIPDLAVAASASSRNRLFLGDGTGAFVPGPEIANGASPRDYVAGLFDGDSILDLAFSIPAVTGDGSVHVLFGAGDGTFPVRAVLPARDDPAAMVAADFDADGDTDLAACNSGQRVERNAISVYENDGAGAFSVAGHFGAGRGHVAAEATDVDGDGRPDILASVSAGVMVLANRTLSHLDCRRGNVNSRGGLIVDVVFVNGSAGSGSERRVDLDPSSPLEVFVAAPPADPAGPAVFLLGAWRGNPGPGDWTDLPFGLGTSCAETPLTASVPRGLLEWWNNIGKRNVLGAPTRPSSPAPIRVARLPAVGREITFFLQGVVRDRRAPNRKAALTNGVLVDVRTR